MSGGDEGDTLAAEGVVLRRAGASDEAAFERVQRAAFAWNREMLGREPLPLQVPASEVLARYETWLLEEDGELVSAMALEPRPDDLLIWSVATDPARQNGGVGRRMLAAAEARARVLGLATLRLYTGSPLVKNIEWYRRRGYAIEREEDQPDGRRVVHMVKEI